MLHNFGVSHVRDVIPPARLPGERSASCRVFAVARMLMENTKLSHLLNEMHWCVLNVPQDCYPLLTGLDDGYVHGG
jgi:hypothetical protein